jgi:hypothetical protein
MVPLRAWLAVVPLGLLIACGGSSTTIGNVNDGGSDSSTGGDGAQGGDAMSGGDSGRGGDSGGSGDTGSAADTGGGVDTGGGGDSGACPDITGSYGQISRQGQGCGDLNERAPECIVLAQRVCAFQLTSVTPAGMPAVNGAVLLQSDGSFSNAALQEGSVQRTGCAGQWDAATQTLTIDCGGMGSSQSCIVTMVRTGSTCM